MGFLEAHVAIVQCDYFFLQLLLPQVLYNRLLCTQILFCFFNYLCLILVYAAIKRMSHSERSVQHSRNTLPVLTVPTGGGVDRFKLSSDFVSSKLHLRCVPRH